MQTQGMCCTCACCSLSLGCHMYIYCVLSVILHPVYCVFAEVGSWDLCNFSASYCIGLNNEQSCLGNWGNLFSYRKERGNTVYIHIAFFQVFASLMGVGWQQQGQALGLFYNAINLCFVIKQNSGPVFYPEDTQETNALHAVALW